MCVRTHTARVFALQAVRELPADAFVDLLLDPLPPTSQGGSVLDSPLWRAVDALCRTAGFGGAAPLPRFSLEDEADDGGDSPSRGGGPTVVRAELGLAPRTQEGAAPAQRGCTYVSTYLYA